MSSVKLSIEPLGGAAVFPKLDVRNHLYHHLLVRVRNKGKLTALPPYCAERYLRRRLQSPRVVLSRDPVWNHPPWLPIFTYQKKYLNKKDQCAFLSLKKCMTILIHVLMLSKVNTWVHSAVCHSPFDKQQSVLPLVIAASIKQYLFIL